MTTIAIHGAGGRMGLRLIALSSEDDSLELLAAIDRRGHPRAGEDVGALAGIGLANVKLTDTLAHKVDVLIDFTVPPATRTAIKMCTDLGCHMVIGTTGLSTDDHRAIDEASQSIAVLQAPNMSLGINLLLALAAQVAKKLGDACDIEIVETHHRFKKDAPSGTALGIAQAICNAVGKDIEKDVVHGRHGGDMTRTPGQIGMHALRSGDVVGRHTVSFGALGEELQLVHIASTRDIFARGALIAAKWLAQKPAGRYGMANVLEL